MSGTQEAPQSSNRECSDKVDEFCAWVRKTVESAFSSDRAPSGMAGAMYWCRVIDIVTRYNEMLLRQGDLEGTGLKYIYDKNGTWHVMVRRTRHDLLTLCQNYVLITWQGARALPPMDSDRVCKECRKRLAQREEGEVHFAEVPTTF